VIPSTPTQHRRAVGAWLLVCVCWSTTFLAIRIGVQVLPPLGMISGTRYIVAGLILGGIVMSRGVPLPSRDSWPGHALLGFLMLGLGNGGLTTAEQWVPSGIAAVMAAATPFWMIGVEALLPSGERIRPLQFAGLLLGFCGLVLLATANSATAGFRTPHFVQGAILIQLSCCGWALGSAYSKRHARHEDAFAAAAMQMVFGGFMLLAAGTLFGEFRTFHLTARGLGAWVYLIVFGALVGYASYNYALKYLPVATVSLYAYITPVLAVVLGAVVMHEPFTPRMAAAIAVIFTGMVVVRQNAGTSRS
jgi:drug/metabolite transporter (DMT)-like permease